MSDIDETHLCTRDEAVRLFKRLRGKHAVTFILGGSVFLPTVREDAGSSTLVETDKGFNGYGCVVITLKQAIEYTRSVLNETLQDRGARLRIRVHHSTAILGKQKLYVHVG